MLCQTPQNYTAKGFQNTSDSRRKRSQTVLLLEAILQKTFGIIPFQIGEVLRPWPRCKPYYERFLEYFDFKPEKVSALYWSRSNSQRSDRLHKESPIRVGMRQRFHQNGMCRHA